MFTIIIIILVLLILEIIVIQRDFTQVNGYII